MEKTYNNKSIMTYILIIIGIIYIFPILLTFTNSLMSIGEIEENYSTEDGIFSDDDYKYIDMNIIPETVTFNQYRHIFLNTPTYINMFWNSVKLTFPILIGQLIVSSVVAYMFTVLRFKFKEILYFLYILVMLLPLQVTMVPNYIVADMLNIKDSYLAIIIPLIFNPFGVVLLRQYMKVFPYSYVEAAQMDGAGHLYIFTKLVLPMIKSGIVSLGILTFIDCWNIVDQAIVFIRESHRQPLSVFLSSINQGEIGVAFASSSFYAIPILLVFFYGQKYLEDGIQTAGLKG
ncbi:carbohydrate ABC transporter permease [Maledivibacter halophilus]|uniref:Carbohydrate ABC transporter membrane protein 2, CUT1 family n=1 Tax=Maledivibacter halophilus TaxID=36842 RepID=A0A1T5MBF8_9FIRM|nr:carbohydrate ABC transporter permease [Maledivibacter halophilus]SKC85209.1 carbohydrate ABC transporter membrane protein 2, CUT1 family [Maledivibacter halophilus]